MKRIFIYVFLIIVFLLCGYYGYIYTPVEVPDTNILNKEYYMFNASTNKYETITIYKRSISYKGSLLSIGGCSNYTLEKTTNTIQFRCGISVRLIELSDDNFVIIDNFGYYYFFDDMDTSYNYEMTKYADNKEESESEINE